MSEVITQSPSSDVITIDTFTPSQPAAEITATPLPGTMPLTSQASTTTDLWFYGKYILVVLVLTMLGYNVFYSLGNLTGFVASIFAPLLSSFGIVLGEGVKSTANTAAGGGKFALDTAAGTVTSATDFLQGAIAQDSPGEEAVANKGNEVINKINATDRNGKRRRIRPPPTADEATSNTQRNNSKRKGGYCYIGEENGIRSCLRVNDANMCMSGDVFPTSEICVNPRLRD
tara:strand:+ start:6990 stop:7679 length:690 start_codon:yes stop_codon:yes gene_type:complete